MSISRVLALSPLLVVAAGCTTFDGKAPDIYVEGLRPDLYWAVPLQDGTVQAVVEFRTAKPNPNLVQKPLGVRVLTWDHLADNVFDGTLAEVELLDPVETSAALSWSGAAAVPSGPWGISARWLGVELRVPYWFEGYETMPQAGGYADVEVDGRGINDYGEWIDAILQLWVQCRGDIGHLLPCHGLGYVVAPAVRVLGFSMPMSADNAGFMYVTNGEVCFERRADGWYYSQPPAMGEQWGPSVGPFAEPEQVVEEAARTLELHTGLGQILEDMPEEWQRLASAHSQRITARASDRSGAR
jgi:hypothetical protein